MPLTIQDVRREVRTALSRISIIDSDTIQVVSGDKPLQPSVRTGVLSGVGDVVGPASAVDNNLAAFDGTTGKLIKDVGLPYPVKGVGIQLNPLLTGTISIGEFDDLTELTSLGSPDLLFIPVWATQIGGFLKTVTVETLVSHSLIAVDEFPSEGPDKLSFFDVSTSNLHSTTIEDFFTDNVGLIDHGGLGGLTDVDDHPDYLLVDGTRDLTGELDLDGNKLVLSADGLSYIHSLAPNLVVVNVGNVSVMNWQDDRILMKLPVDLLTDVLTFGTGAQMHAPGVNQLDVVIDSVSTVQFRTFVAVFNTDIDLNDNEIFLGANGNTTLRGVSNVVTLKISGDDQVQWDDFQLTLGMEPTGSIGVYTIKGGDASGEGVGGTLLFRGGAGSAEVDGTVQLATADATVRLEINLDGTVDIRDTVIDADLITLGDAGAAFLIVPKAPSAAAGVDLTVRAGPGDGGGTGKNGGDLFLESGVGAGISPDGDVFIRDGSGTVLAQFKVSGEVDFVTAGMKINANGSIAGLPSIQIDSGGIIGFDNDNKWVLTEDLLHSWTVNAVLAMTLSDDTLDGQGTTRLTGFKGMRETFAFSYHVVSTVTTQWTYYAAFAISGSAGKRGAYMFRSGSVVNVAITCDVNVVGSGDTLEGVAYVNNTHTGFVAELTGLIVANGLDADNTQALGLDTFVKGDYINAKRILTGASPGQVSTDDFTIHVEVEYD